MRRFPALLLVAAACGGTDGPVEPSPVRSITVTLSAYQIVVGSTSQGQAAMFDAQGVPVTDRSPTWTSLAPNVATVSAAGVITALQAGTATVRATSGNVSGEAQVLVTNPKAGSITLSRDSATVFIPNGSVQLIPVVKDSGGNVITNPTIFWQSLSPLIATVNFSGLVSGVAVGSATIQASLDGQVAQTTIFVKATPNSSAPFIVNINPAILRPGGTYTVVGNNFATTVAGNAVVVDGVPVTVNSPVTANAMSITLPQTGFACEPSRTAFVQITTNGLIGGGNGTLSVPTPRTLSPGQSVVVSGASEVRCNELVSTGSRYVLSVYNAYRAAVQPGFTGSAAVTLRGAAGTPSIGAVAAGGPSSAPSALRTWDGGVPRIGGIAWDAAGAITRARARQGAHERLLERNIEYLRANRASLSAQLAAHARAPAAAPGIAGAIGTQIATIGAVSQVKVPNIDVSNYCSSNIPINVRTVFVGQHAIIVEDTASVFNGKPTLQGQMGSYFTQLGNEFDTVMWPILTGNFGNPMVLDAALSATGKVVMVFSPRVNLFQGGSVLGFVVTCDFATVAQSPSSNVGEYFYAPVPTSTLGGYANGETRDSWLRVIRATIIHEVKHITAFAERLSRGLSFEDAAWEEGMARHVEELYARTFYGTQAKQNTAYAASVYCDLRYSNAAFPQCANRPVLMLRHFDGLETYLALPESYSPLGRVFAADASFYGSSWSIERWAADHLAASEAQFLKDFTTSTSTGVLNLEARTGRPWEEMLGEWSLAMYLDDEPDFTPENTRLRMPSWNLRDVWQGLCNDLGPCTPNNPLQLYPRPSPFQPHALTFGTFSLNASIAGGSFGIFELTGTQAGKQLLELRSQTGGDPPGTIRLAIVRVQ